jgi:hypothetical protein
MATLTKPKIAATRVVQVDEGEISERRHHSKINIEFLRAFVIVSLARQNNRTEKLVAIINRNHSLLPIVYSKKAPSGIAFKSSNMSKIVKYMEDGHSAKQVARYIVGFQEDVSDYVFMKLDACSLAHQKIMKKSPLAELLSSKQTKAYKIEARSRLRKRRNK